MSTTTAAKPAFALKTSKEPDNSPERILIYGPSGEGKTTFAANASRPIFFDLEKGLRGNLDGLVERAENVTNWPTLLQAVEWLLTGDHEFETVVIDTLDRAEAWCWAFLCAKHKVPHLNDIGGGYGKGFHAAVEQFHRLYSALERLRLKRNMRVIIVAHSKVENVSNPDGQDYGKHGLNVQKDIAHMFVRDMDMVLFATRNVTAPKDESGKRAKAIGGTKRLLVTTPSPTCVAKNRYRLPPKIDLSWDVLVQVLAESNKPELLRKTVLEKARRTGDQALFDALTRHVPHASVAKLVEYMGKIDGRLEAQEEQAPQEAPAATPDADAEAQAQAQAEAEAQVQA